MSTEILNELDSSVRAAREQLHDGGVLSPEVLMLLGTGSEDIAPLLSERVTIELGELDGTPAAWRAAQINCGKLADVRVWLCDDAPLDDPRPWARAWPIWLARAAGAGSCLLSAAGSALPGVDPAPPAEGYFLARDHLALEGASVLRGLSDSTLGPLFPDQGSVHLDLARHELLQAAARVGIDCAEGVLACVPGPALETPAERAYLAHAGAHASAQNLSGALHAMAHAGLGGLCLVALLGGDADKVEDLLAAADRLAPGLLELLTTAIPPLAAHSRAQAKEQL